MSFIDTLIGYLAPYDCLSCGQEGALLCPNCIKALPPMVERCYRCHKPSADSLTCQPCLADTALARVKPAVVYGHVAKDLIWKLKSNGAQAAARIMANHMARDLSYESGALLVPVPTSSDRVRQRGYDQATLLAKELGRLTKIPSLACLVRQNRVHQVGANRSQRHQQLKKAFRVSNPRPVKNRTIILIDDVTTTGSTLESAAQTLKLAGALHIEALVFAQPLYRIDTK